MAIFRSVKISQIDFVLDDAAAKLQATVYTEPEGLIKRYSFNCLDGEVLQATVDRDAYPTVVIAEASELEKLLSSFQHTLDEITLIANPVSAAALANGHKACEIRSFVDPLKAGQESALLTSLTLDTRSVFTSYSHASPDAADVTFNVRDFRAMAALCTALGADVALRLEGAGAPLLVEPHFRGLAEGSETDFSAMLVLSTLTDSQLGPEHQQNNALAAQQQPQHPDARQQARTMTGTTAVPGQQPLPSPYQDPNEERTEQGMDWEAGGGRAGAAGAAAAASDGVTGAGSGRRRLPQRPGNTQGADGGLSPAAPSAARAAYAAAAAAEGLPPAVTGGGYGAAGAPFADAAPLPTGSVGGGGPPGGTGAGGGHPLDPRRAAGAVASGVTGPGPVAMAHQDYVQFRGVAPVTGGVAAAASSHGADSQDPEGLPGMR
ncbi:hypothetical protein GPECTOR_2g1252 [Gonium pectorale]|uniref:Cell cycle checkpoint control protein RAD9A n=1 Tax=Gonium pectorale TaxID=33097 RepID=A0A150H157_GONPE|nr:hypothetical protein GPECTOR_2g1252 [Gonium pectorale]|eukprot:KXZ55702.1 hypothetical protein GPECTOR_2g1252 [Gonium pectorale]